MTSLLRSALSVGFLTLGFTILSTGIVEAAIVTYDFQISIDSGVLLGNIYNGNLSYDDSSLTGVTSESIGLSSFLLPFQGNTYTLADDPGATADFSLNTFLGANFSPLDASFSLTSGYLTSNINDSYFAYDLGGVAQQGTGAITYTATVPEPSTIFGLGIITALGLGSSLKRKRNRSVGF